MLNPPPAAAEGFPPFLPPSLQKAEVRVVQGYGSVTAQRVFGADVGSGLGWIESLLIPDSPCKQS